MLRRAERREKLAIAYLLAVEEFLMASKGCNLAQRPFAHSRGPRGSLLHPSEGFASSLLALASVMGKAFLPIFCCQKKNQPSSQNTSS